MVAFIGVRMSDPKNQRDWLLTIVWAFSMDAVAASLVLMTCSSFCMWFGLKQKSNLGIVALKLGAVGLRIVLGRPSVAAFMNKPDFNRIL